MCTLTLTLPPLPHAPTATSTLHYLERRSSYLAKAPYQQNRPVKQKLTDAALRLDPTTWLAPAILRAHDVYEYKKDRRKLEEQYQTYRHEQLMKKKVYRGEDGGFYTDVTTSTAKRAGPMTSSTTLMGSGRGSAIGARSEMNLPRARALEWAGSGSVFSPGLLQEWMVVRGVGWEDDEDLIERLGPDPWALPPIEQT